MAITFLDLIAVLLWPLVLTAAVWGIAIKALAETDEISKVVETLIQPNGADEKQKPWKSAFSPEHKICPPRGNLGAIARGYGVWFQVHFKPTRHPNSTFQDKRLDDEKDTFARR